MASVIVVTVVWIPLHHKKEETRIVSSEKEKRKQ
jgi:hypothetical protein